MCPEVAFALFDSLTDKQRETLVLACSHLTSKEIAHAMGVAPVTIDKRIEGIRARLGNITRSELLRLFRQWHPTYGRPIDDPIILVGEANGAPELDLQPADYGLVFEDSVPFDGRASWDRGSDWLRPGLKPSDLGTIGRLMAIICGALAIMMLAVLSMAFADALMGILTR